MPTSHRENKNKSYKLYNYFLVNSFIFQISKYPQVRVTSDNLLRSTLTMNETARSAFLEHSETLVQKVTAAWCVIILYELLFYDIIKSNF